MGKFAVRFGKIRFSAKSSAAILFADRFRPPLRRGGILTSARTPSTASCGHQAHHPHLVRDKHADEAVVSAASAVFLSTAVLPSGRLDVLVVLVAQTRLIWKVAHVYYQRPSLREFLQLYANVTSTAFIAAGLEDVDIDVLVSTILGSTVASIPVYLRFCAIQFCQKKMMLLPDYSALNPSVPNYTST
jgi:hypothetical protein